MSPNSNEHDGNTLVPLKQFGSASETEVVIALLRSGGIPAVCAGRYSLQILIPFKYVAEANRLIADARDGAPSPIPTTEPVPEEPRSTITDITWLLVGGGLIVMGLWMGWRSGW